MARTASKILSAAEKKAHNQSIRAEIKDGKTLLRELKKDVTAIKKSLAAAEKAVAKQEKTVSKLETKLVA